MSKHSVLNTAPDLLYPTLAWPGWGAGGCICDPLGSCCMKASTFLLVLNSPLFHFTEFLLTSLCLHWKENQKLSHYHDVPFSPSSYQGESHQPPLQGVWPAPRAVGHMRPCGSSRSQHFLSLVSTSFSSLTSICFLNWWNTWSKAFPHLQLFPG